MSEQRQLTKAEEEVMHYMWQLGRCTVSDIIGLMPDPKPPHSSVSTIVRILEKKGFVDHKAYGRTYEYFPLISKDDYSEQSLDKLVNDYFEGSFSSLVSFIAKEKNLDMNEMNQLMTLLDKLPE